jgi:hypothetical protein
MPRDPLDAAVRAHLEADGRAANSDRVLASVLDALANLRPQSRRAFLLPLAAAAALFIALFSVSPNHTVHASPADVVREAEQVHLLAQDRCYTIRTELAESLSHRFPRFDFRVENRLWTRGDRFWIEGGSPERRWAWGRDEQGRVWIAPSHGAGARFNADEIPDLLSFFVEMRAVRLPTLLAEARKHCELSFEDDTGGIQVIRATPRSSKGITLADARLEIDARSHVVRKLVLRRRVAGKELGTLTMTLIRSASRPDIDYTLEGHLRPGAAIHDRTHEPLRRQQVLLRWLGGLNP